MNASRTNCFSIELARIRISNALTSAQHCFKLRSAARTPAVLNAAESRLHREAVLEVRQGNRIWRLRLLKADSTSWGSGAINSDRGCRNAEEPASVRSFARRKGSSVVNHLPDFSYAIALMEIPACIEAVAHPVLEPIPIGPLQLRKVW